jgi:hypothetical protein
MALHDFCCGLEEGLNLVEMVPYADGLLRGVVDLVKMDNDGIRIQVLEALAVLIPVAKETVSQECHHIVQLCAQVFIKCCNDPGVLSVLDEVFSSLARQPSCQEAILSDFASLAVKVLRPISETGVATGMVAAILDIWTNVILNFPSPLPLATVEVVFPSVVSAVLKVDDSAILQVWSCSPTLMFCVLVLFTCLEWRRLFEGVPDKRGGAVGGVVYNHGGKWFATVCEDYTPLVGSQPVRVLMFISGSFSHRAHQAGWFGPWRSSGNHCQECS